MDTDDPPVAPLPPGEPLDLTEYETGFVDGYLASRGVFESAPRELQRALAALKRHREGHTDRTQMPYGFLKKPTAD